MNQEVSTTKTCIHSRKIRSFLDDSDNPRFAKFKQHLDGCSVCCSSLALEKGLLDEIDKMVPVLSPSDELTSGIRNELIEAFRGVDISASVSFSERVTLNASSFAHWAIDFGRFLISKQMLVTYLFASSLGVFLKYVF